MERLQVITFCSFGGAFLQNEDHVQGLMCFNDHSFLNSSHRYILVDIIENKFISSYIITFRLVTLAIQALKTPLS